MSAFVVIVPTPYSAVTDSDGSFEIKDVPPGTYTLKTWSEDGKVTTQSVTVASGIANAELIVKK
jgi:Fe2+ transport system protein B